MLKNPRRFAGVVAWSLVLWVVNGLSFAVCFRAFGLPVPWEGAFLLQGLIGFGVALPSSPGFFGPVRGGHAHHARAVRDWRRPGGELRGRVPPWRIRPDHLARPVFAVADAGAVWASCGGASGPRSEAWALNGCASPRTPRSTCFSASWRARPAASTRSRPRSRCSSWPMSWWCAARPAASTLEVTPGGPDLGSPDENLAVRGARAVLEATGHRFGVTIELTKRIPVRAGLGGGSSDAAAALHAVNALAGNAVPRAELVQMAARIGSDVAFFASGAALALGWGRGERILQLDPLPASPALVAVPPIGIADAGCLPVVGRDARHPRAARRRGAGRADARHVGERGTAGRERFRAARSSAAIRRCARCSSASPRRILIGCGCAAPAARSARSTPPSGSGTTPRCSSARSTSGWSRRQPGRWPRPDPKHTPQ